jgi:hypothetical protein
LTFFPFMPFPALRSLLPFLFFLSATVSANARIDPIADEAVAAVMKLRSRPEYTWDISILKPGDPSLPAQPRTVHGAMTGTGEMIVEQIWPDGLVLETISRRDGAAVIRTPDGWFSKAELEQLSKRPKRGQSKWLWFATEALEPMTPEEQLTRLLNDTTSCERNGDIIEGVLSERGASFWLGSGHLVRNATGKVQLRLRDGLVRECRFSVEGEQPLDGAGAKSQHISFESVLTFNYSASPPAIAEEAKRKLDEARRR